MKVFPALVDFKSGIAVLEKGTVVKGIVGTCHVGALIACAGNPDAVKFVVAARHAEPIGILHVGELRKLKVDDRLCVAFRVKNNRGRFCSGIFQFDRVLFAFDVGNYNIS